MIGAHLAEISETWQEKLYLDMGDYHEWVAEQSTPKKERTSTTQRFASSDAASILCDGFRDGICADLKYRLFWTEQPEGGVGVMLGRPGVARVAHISEP
ncbi:hypothetical protein WPS_14280 [Vulcanimicrobium alpinum]|uniref:Uncharacterized protein n=1 Tax=Vulcanimicrobium alpinum TaxID=3016050 RepID=A0AAN1XVF7_UNVUL|nr:hypothetical protein WPS_14280 [Vulcanimicrobium alpinum]